MSALSALHLRPAMADEGAQLADLRVRAMRESLKAAGRFDPIGARARFLDSFVPADTQVVVSAGRDVGLLVLRRDSPEWLLDHLCIDPDHQGRGIGSQVLQRVLDLADRHQRPLRVGALKGSRSHAFYQRQGFSLVETAEWDLIYVRQPRPITQPLPAHQCPLCGQTNACAAALSGSFDEPCWCRDVTFDTAVLARIPVSQQGLACLCKACAQGARS